MRSNDYPKYTKGEIRHIIKDHNHKIVWCPACGFTIKCGYCGKNVCETDYFDKKKFREIMKEAPILSIKQVNLLKGPTKFQISEARKAYKDYIENAKKQCVIICSDNCDEAKMLYDRRDKSLTFFQRIKNFFYNKFN